MLWYINSESTPPRPPHPKKNPNNNKVVFPILCLFSQYERENCNN